MLLHVSDMALPVGTELRPYAIAQNHRELLRLAVRAIDKGPDAVVDLLAGAAWSHLVTLGDYLAGMVLLEAVFERVRLQIAPDLPSRFGVVFAWGTLADAVRYRDAYLPAGVIHRCAVVAGRSVERDGSLVVRAFEEANFAHPQATGRSRADEHAVRYWRGQVPMAHPEVLVEGTVVVEEVVAAPSP